MNNAGGKLYLPDGQFGSNSHNMHIQQNEVMPLSNP